MEYYSAIKRNEIRLFVEMWMALETGIQSEVNQKEKNTEARRTTTLQPVEQKPHSQKDRQNEKAESYVPDEGTR